MNAPPLPSTPPPTTWTCWRCNAVVPVPPGATWGDGVHLRTTELVCTCGVTLVVRWEPTRAPE